MHCEFCAINLAIAVLLIAFAGVSVAALSPGQVLVVYNSLGPDDDGSTVAESKEVHDYYLTKRPGVLSFDLKDATLTSPTISYTNFTSKVRDPIRAHLAHLETQEPPTSVIVIVLTKGIPHRIDDLNTANLGDAPTSAGDAYNAGNATYASVDSELTLLQIDLEQGEAGGNLDSQADRAILNPYFDKSDSIAGSNYPRDDIALTKHFRTTQLVPNYGWWKMYNSYTNFRRNEPSTPGDIYLTCRLDGETVDDVKAMIDRAQNVVFRPERDAVLLDKNSLSITYEEYTHPTTSEERNDYERTSDILSNWVSRFQFNEDSTFLTGLAGGIAYTPTSAVSAPIAFLGTYGANHGGSNTNYLGYVGTFNGHLIDGAIWSSYESYAARGLGGLGTLFSQGQTDDWIAAGGTFAIGSVWEPFTWGVARNEMLLNAFYIHGLTWVESAWSSLMMLSWQTVVIGDPLARALILPDVEPVYDEGLDRLQLTFTIPDPLAPNRTYTVQVSETLAAGSWTDIATKVGTAGWTGGAAVDETITGSVNQVVVTDVAGGTRRFMRLVVSFN